MEETANIDTDKLWLEQLVERADASALIKPKVIFQSNIITTAKYQMSAMEKDILLYSCSLIKKGCNSDTIFKISVAEFVIATKKSVNYKQFVEAAIKLRSRNLHGFLPDGRMFTTGFINYCDYSRGDGYVNIKFDSSIIPHYIDLSNRFTEFQLNHALKLNSIYSKRIYEWLCMYKNLPNKSTVISLVELKERLGIIINGKDKYKNYNLFLKNVMEPADHEINGHTDIYFSYKAIEAKKSGKGRKPIEKLSFHIIYNRDEILDEKYEGDQLKIYNRLCDEFKLRPDQAQEALSLHTLTQLNSKMYDIKIVEMNKKIKTNIGAYTKTVLGLTK